MEEFICEKCTRIRHTPVMIKSISSLEQIITPDFEEITGTVASIRLDSVIGVAFRGSRSSMMGLIEGGKVHVNGKMITSNGYHLKEKDIVSVRGYGKFQYEKMLSETKKGRSRIQINRYC
jgi:RNA-binding protein YlmH